MSQQIRFMHEMKTAQIIQQTTNLQKILSKKYGKEVAQVDEPIYAKLLKNYEVEKEQRIKAEKKAKIQQKMAVIVRHQQQFTQGSDKKQSPNIVPQGSKINVMSLEGSQTPVEKRGVAFHDMNQLAIDGQLHHKDIKNLHATQSPSKPRRSSVASQGSDTKTAKFKKDPYPNDLRNIENVSYFGTNEFKLLNTNYLRSKILREIDLIS